MKRILPQLFFFIFFLAARCTGQVKFTATITPDKIGKNEYVELKLIVENGEDVEKIILPALKNFTIVGGPNRENGTSIINNIVKKYTALSYFIKPSTTGLLSIPPATAIVDGKKLMSNSTSLQVTNSAGNNPAASPFTPIDRFIEENIPVNDNILKPGESAPDKIQKNMFIKMDVDKTSCFVGEPVVVTYKLYTRLKSESVLTKNPSFNGFSVIDLKRTDNANYNQETINGKPYNVYTIRKAQLYPLQPGNIEVEKAEVENNIQFIKEEYITRQGQIWSDLFNDFSQAALPPEAIENHKVTLQSNIVFIAVKPLPEANKPKNFKGAIGNFEIAANLKKNNLTTDESGKLILKISGEGNLQLITAPGVEWPAGVEGYEPKITNTLNKLSVPVSGDILYEYNFTVDSIGKYIIPAMTFSYFDNKNNIYKTAATSAIHFTVEKGKERKQAEPLIEKRDKNFFDTFFSNRWWIIIAVALLIITSLMIWVKKENKKDTNLKNMALNNIQPDEKDTALAIDKNWLGSAEIYLNNNNPVKFYTELNTGFKTYLAHILKIKTQQLDTNTIIVYLNKENIPENITQQTQRILKDIQYQLYTPEPDYDQQQHLFDNTKKTIEDIDGFIHP